MGGLAFSHFPDPPYTPRMPTRVYERVKTSCHHALRELFVHVATPIEGPGKADHGDVDILVALERRSADAAPSSTKDLIEKIKTALGAEHSIAVHNMANLAIPWPSSLATNGHGALKDDEQHQQPRHIQVDVRICKDKADLDWYLFKHAHGDLWNLLGSTIRPFGLTVDENALWLRIPEIEKFNRKRAKVFLTSDPTQILQFLGMEVDGFWTEPFDSVEALFDYATTCRFFSVREDLGDEDEANGDTDLAGSVGGEAGQKKLKSNDRRRMNTRPVYHRWINEFIPQLRAEGRFLRPDKTPMAELRENVRDEALATFNVDAEYNKKLRDWHLEKNSEKVKNMIRTLVPEREMDPQRKSCIVSAMKKIILEDGIGYENICRPSFKDAEGFYDIGAVQDFLQHHQVEVNQAAWEIQLQRSREALQRKRDKEKLETGK
ncbi:hypothetical protein QBC35DRAFT_373007 [Podospora australis]|uniref:Uncharacterized protein n=1 Tax=Podospora australis TaxID=1536484 RepID=A0AAN6X2G0_9PEZI|nr:hypothetical protein QBC35DRAFT_373007 [Podospora australis]